MKTVFLTLLASTILTVSTTMGQIISPEQIVQKNLDCYNNRDIEGFMSFFSESITLYNFSDHNITAKGLTEVRKLYTDLFASSPNLHSTILKRLVFKNKVIDHESIVGRKGSKDVVELILIYEIQNDKIYKITVMRE